VTINWKIEKIQVTPITIIISLAKILRKSEVCKLFVVFYISPRIRQKVGEIFGE
jgi:hypothetical protein